MRLNAPPPAVFPAPDTLPVRGIDGARVVQPVNNEDRREREPPPMAQPRAYRPVPGAPDFMEQRAIGRRSADRRRAQVPVLLDTRTGEDRRRQPRRDRDERPLSVDVKA